MSKRFINLLTPEILRSAGVAGRPALLHGAAVPSIYPVFAQAGGRHCPITNPHGLRLNTSESRLFISAAAGRYPCKLSAPRRDVGREYLFKCRAWRGTETHASDILNVENDGRAVSMPLFVNPL